MQVQGLAWGSTCRSLLLFRAPHIAAKDNEDDLAFLKPELLMKWLQHSRHDRGVHGVPLWSTHGPHCHTVRQQWTPKQNGRQLSSQCHSQTKLKAKPIYTLLLPKWYKRFPANAEWGVQVSIHLIWPPLPLKEDTLQHLGIGKPRKTVVECRVCFILPSTVRRVPQGSNLRWVATSTPSKTPRRSQSSMLPARWHAAAGPQSQPHRGPRGAAGLPFILQLHPRIWTELPLLMHMQTSITQ